jgi:hypothetical protein
MFRALRLLEPKLRHCMCRRYRLTPAAATTSRHGLIAYFFSLSSLCNLPASVDALHAQKRRPHSLPHSSIADMHLIHPPKRRSSLSPAEHSHSLLNLMSQRIHSSHCFRPHSCGERGDTGKRQVSTSQDHASLA